MGDGIKMSWVENFRKIN